MAEKDTTPQRPGAKPAAADRPQATAQTDRVASAAPSGDRDRSQPRMSEGVRQELVAQGFATDPHTGDLIVSDGADDKGKPQGVRVIPRAQAVEEIKRRTAEADKRNEPADTEQRPAL